MGPHARLGPSSPVRQVQREREVEVGMTRVVLSPLTTPLVQPKCLDLIPNRFICREVSLLIRIELTQ